MYDMNHYKIERKKVSFSRMQSEAVRRFMEHREGLTKVSAPVPVSNLKQTKKPSGNLTMANIIENKPSTPEIVEFFKQMVEHLIEEEELSKA